MRKMKLGLLISVLALAVFVVGCGNKASEEALASMEASIAKGEALTEYQFEGEMIGTAVSIKAKGSKLLVGNDFSTSIIDDEAKQVTMITDTYAMINELTEEDAYLRASDVKERYVELKQFITDAAGQAEYSMTEGEYLGHTTVEYQVKEKGTDEVALECKFDKDSGLLVSYSAAGMDLLKLNSYSLEVEDAAFEIPADMEILN